MKNRRARDVPLHPHLIEQGLVNFVGSAATGPLFYEVSRPGTTANPAYRKVGDKLAAWVRLIGIDRDVAPNHGWRHGFVTVARVMKIEPTVIDHICGHAPRTVGEGYGEFKLASLAEDVAKIPRYDVAPPSGRRPHTAASKRRTKQRLATLRRAKTRDAGAGGPIPANETGL